MLSTTWFTYGVATISRLLKIIGLFCRISSLLYGSFAKETLHVHIIQLHVRIIHVMYISANKTYQPTGCRPLHVSSLIPFSHTFPPSVFSFFQKHKVVDNFLADMLSTTSCFWKKETTDARNAGENGIREENGGKTKGSSFGWYVLDHFIFSPIFPHFFFVCLFFFFSRDLG